MIWRRILPVALIVLALIAAVPLTLLIQVRWMESQARAVTAKQPPGYWGAIHFPFAWSQVVVGVPIDPELRRRCEQASRELNKALPKSENPLVLVPLRVVNLRKTEYRHQLSYRLVIRAVSSDGGCAMEGGYDPDLLPPLSDPELQERLAARQQPVPPGGTVDMLATCLLMGGDTLDWGQIGDMSIDTDPFGYILRPNFRAPAGAAGP